MVSRPDISSVHPVGRTDPTRPPDALGGARQEAFARTMSALVGKSMLSQVLSRLADGNFIVRVEGNPVRMPLPPGTKIGSEVPLTLLSTDPRPTFQITNGNGQALPGTLYTPPSLASRAAQLLADSAEPLPGKGAPAAAGTAGTGQAAALSGTAQTKEAATAPPAGAPPAPVLSAAGRVISGVIVAAQNAPGAALALEGHQPLMSNQAPQPAQLATRLQDAIGQSGLFYESHLAEWAEGTRPLSDLMREPQTGRAPGSPAIDPTTAQFINLQLSSQEQARVAWQGQLWPGQHMQWEIQKDGADPRGGRDADGEQTPTWRSGMTFRLPLLGEIAATVVMAGDTFRIEIQTGTSEVGSMLRSHAGTLTDAMAAAGTPLAALSIGVKHEDGHG